MKIKLFIVATVLFFTLIGTLQIWTSAYGDYDLDEYSSVTEGTGNLLTIDSSFNNKPFKLQDFVKPNKYKDLLAINTFCGGNGFLYSLISNVWLQWSFESTRMVRFLSVLFYLASTLLVFYISLSLFKDKISAFLAVFLFSLNPLILEYGSNFRMYMAGTFLTLLATLLFLKWLDCKDKKKKTYLAIGYGLVSGMSLLIHYFCVFILIGHGFYLLLLLFKKKTKFNLALCLPYILSTSILFSWLLYAGIDGFKYMSENSAEHLKIAKGIGHIGLSNIKETNLEEIAIYLYKSFCLWSENYAYWEYFNYGVSFRYILMLMLAPVFLLAFGLLNKKNKEGEEKLHILLLVILGLVSFAFLIFFAFNSGHTVSLMLKYTIFSFPYLWILAAYGFRQSLLSKNKLLKISSYIALIAICLNTLFNVYFRVRDLTKENENGYITAQSILPAKLRQFKEENTWVLKSNNIKVINELLGYIKVPNNISIQTDTNYSSSGIVLHNSKTEQDILLFSLNSGQLEQLNDMRKN